MADHFSQHIRNASISQARVASVLSDHCCHLKTEMIKFHIKIFVKISQHILISAKMEKRDNFYKNFVLLFNFLFLVLIRGRS